LYDLKATATTLRRTLTVAQRSSKAVSTLSPEAAFVEWLTTGDALVKALVQDPLLPPALLPDTWPASELRQIFSRWNTLYWERSAPFVHQALNQ
jgi:DNA-binding transcriptional regulator PaaX